MSRAPDILGSDARPSFFPVANTDELGLVSPPDRLGVPVRTWARALAGMQKEALVVNGASGRAWRLVSDEGPYLDGHDQAPCPLCTFITGMVSSYMGETLRLAAARGLSIDDVELTLANHYSMKGSALAGTMLGGAQTPQLTARISADADSADLEQLVQQAVRAAPINGLIDGSHNSLFNLSRNGDQIPVGDVQEMGTATLPDPDELFDRVGIASTSVADGLMVKVKPADQVEGVPGGVNTSLQESQSRTLHVQATCRVRDDGVKVIHENLFRPIGSEFQFLSDEAPGFGGEGRAPDAATYLAAGIAFCFLTQFGRYARITKRQLDEYRVVQDTHFSAGGDGVGTATPVETHVYLVTPEDDEFARKALDMSERTCFLHATCRTDLDVNTTVLTNEDTG
ncbi:MAG: OsmC family protein [Acidimicrobiia bacterium]|jgi:organic hydroperoxide reductase OsmC/OhrA